MSVSSVIASARVRLSTPIYKKQTNDVGGWSYAALPEAESKTFYVFEGDWFYVVENKAELSNLVSSGNWLTSTNPNQKVNITDKNNLTKSIPMNNLIITRVDDMSYVFDTFGSFNQVINNWDVSNVTDMDTLFRGCTLFNQDIGGWDVSKVTQMHRVLFSASSFNQDISGWNTDSLVIMSNMLNGASSFNQDIGKWNTSNVTNMNSIFRGANSFNMDISGWDVSKVTTMITTFDGATNFNQDLSLWCVDQIPTRPTNFDRNTPAWTLPKPVWGTCPTAPVIFKKQTNDVGGWSYAALPEAESKTFYVFEGDWFYVVDNRSELNSLINSGNWLTSTNPNQEVNITDKNNLTKSIPMNNLIVSNITNFDDLFYTKTNFNQVIERWDVSNVTTMDKLFMETSFNSPLNNWDMSNVILARDIFKFNAHFNQPLEDWDVSKVDNIAGIFYGATSFNQDIGKWKLSSVTNLRYMFSDATSFNKDISVWDTSNIPQREPIRSDPSMEYMFDGATSFNQDLSTWCVFNIKSQAPYFDRNTPSWTLPKPNWGAPC